MSRKVIVVGAGYTGMSVAAYLAANGFEVEIFEKNEQPGGRARHLAAENFTFDMGPSWYCLPEVIDNFFSVFNHKSSDFFSLHPVDPVNRIYFAKDDFIDVPMENSSLYELFQSLENNGGVNLKRYIKHAELVYTYFLQQIENPNWTGKLANISTIHLIGNLLNAHKRNIGRLFKNPKTIMLLNKLLPTAGFFPASSSLARYILNYSILKYGPVYPEGGIFHLTEALEEILQELKILVYYGSAVESFDVINDRIAGVITHGKTFHADIFVSAADYHHTEQLIPKEYRNYPEDHWQVKEQMPLVIVYFLGFDKKISSFKPVNTVFRKDNSGNSLKHKSRLPGYETITVISPSKLDVLKAPKGKDSLIVRIVLGKGIEDTGKMREHYYEQTLKYLEYITGEALLKHVIYKKSYTQTDFEEDYNTYKGEAFGWQNIRHQSGKSKVKIRNQHLLNLFYAEYPVWQVSGIPSVLLSGKIVSNEIIKVFERFEKTGIY